MVLPGQFDPIGRGLLFFDPSKRDQSQCSRESLSRSLWYAVHAALETESVQQKGIVFISFPKNAKFSQFDSKLDKMHISAIRGCLPLRVGAFHVCHPPSFVAIIFPIIKLMMGERLRKRIKVYSGSDKKVLKKLEPFGLTKDMLPKELGGDLELDQAAWLAARKSDRK